MEQALNSERWITVRVEDTGDGLTIHPDDAQKWALEADQAYEGYFLPDGCYRIKIIPRTPTAIEASPVVGEIEATVWQYRTKSIQKAGVGWCWSDWKNGRAGKGYGFEFEERALVPAASLASLQSENQALREERDGARKWAYEQRMTKHRSGCACHISDDEKLVSICNFHKEFVERAEAAESRVQSLTLKLVERDKDAARYRWLRDERAENNRWPHIYQYPYQPNIDTEKVPQFVDGWQPRNPDNLDAAIDLAIARALQSGGAEQ